MVGEVGEVKAAKGSVRIVRASERANMIFR